MLLHYIQLQYLHRSVAFPVTHIFVAWPNGIELINKLGKLILFMFLVKMYLLKFDIVRLIELIQKLTLTHLVNAIYYAILFH